MRRTGISAGILGTSIALFAVVGVAGCSVAPAPSPSPAVKVVASPANRMLLGLRRGDVSAGGVEIDVTCQNLTATTMTVPVKGLACEVEAVPKGPGRSVSARLLMLNQKRYSGMPVGAAVPPTWRAASGEAVGGSVWLPLAPGEYSVRARLASDTAIVAVPITVRVTKR